MISDKQFAKLAAMKDAKEKSDPREEFWENVIAIAIVLILILAVSWWLYAKLNPAPPTQDERVSMPIGASPYLGADNATITVVEFSDFECFYCGQFAREQFPLIKQRYIDTGEVRFAYKNFPLTQAHPEARLAAEAAMCVHAQGKFWEYNRVLYAHQDALSAENLTAYASTLGLDMPSYNDCIANQLSVRAVDQDLTLGTNSGVTGTPTFFFNGRRVLGALTIDEFAAEVAKETKN
jgi:protein-disulfide isomerase